jgi:hypothetical protein
MLHPIARNALFVSLLIPNVSCSSDGDGNTQRAGSSGLGGGTSAAGAGGVSYGGAGGTSAGATTVAGTSAAGASPGGGGATSGSGGTSGGSGYTPEQLLTATYAECSKGCRLVAGACPSSNVVNCTEGCNSQADNYFDSAKCGVEFFDAWSCINRTLSASDIVCPTTAGGLPTFNGCSAEQSRYTACQ